MNQMLLYNQRHSLLGRSGWKRMLKKGRPRPSLKNLTTTVKDKNKSYTRHFTIEIMRVIEIIYQIMRVNSLCGSEIVLKLFCWPCLLFPKPTNNIRVSSVFSNLNGLSKSAKAHENSENHLQYVVNLYNFGKKRLES